MAASVKDTDVGFEYVREPCEAKSVAEIDIFEVKKVLLIPASNEIVGLALHHYGGARKPACIAALAVIIGSLVSASPWIRRPDIAQERMPDTSAE